MLLVGGVILATLVGAVAGGIVAWRRSVGWESHFRILAIMLPAGLLLLTTIWISRVLSAPENYWNQARLAPLFSMRYGYHLYYPPGEGPVNGAIYGPISSLAYFPALAASSPTPSLLIGSLTASIYYFAPVAWIFLSGSFRKREARIVGLSLFTLFALWTLGSQPLWACSFNIHVVGCDRSLWGDFLSRDTANSRDWSALGFGRYIRQDPGSRVCPCHEVDGSRNSVRLVRIGRCDSLVAQPAIPGSRTRSLDVRHQRRRTSRCCPPRLMVPLPARFECGSADSLEAGMSWRSPLMKAGFRNWINAGRSNYALALPQ